MSRLAESLAPQMFGGQTYVPKRDQARLSHQLSAVKHLMLDGAWRTLSEIHSAIGAPEASISARLRDLRRMGFRVDREFVERGLYRYRVVRA